MEQHPFIFETLLFAGVGMLFPGSWFLRPLLSLFGFGPRGPVRGQSALHVSLVNICKLDTSTGSAAAWAQSVFFGAGSWFATLQRAAMKAVPPHVGTAIVGGVLTGIGAIGKIFQGGVAVNDSALGN